MRWPEWSFYRKEMVKPSISQATAAECVRSLRTAKTNSFSFHGQLAEFWNRYDSINDFDFITEHLTNDERIARMTLTHLVERVFNASRHADLMRLIRRNFPNRHVYIQGWFPSFTDCTLPIVFDEIPVHS